MAVARAPPAPLLAVNSHAATQGLGFKKRRTLKSQKLENTETPAHLHVKGITRDKSRNSDPRTLTNELLRRWNDKEVLEVIVILIIIHVVIQVEKEHSSDLTADVARQQPPGSNLAGWIFFTPLGSIVLTTDSYTN